MARPYSQDLRDRVVASVAGGRSRRATATIFSVSVATVVRWSQRFRRTGSAAALAMGGHRPHRLASRRDWLLARIADQLPIKWTDKTVTLGDQTFPLDHHVPTFIYPNPLNPKRYIVVNSGVTFREYDYLNNARQIAKLPDYAIYDINTPRSSRYAAKVVTAGFFDEHWALSK